MKQILFSCVILCSSLFAAEKLTIFSARKTQLVEHVFDAYTAKTGVEIDFLTDKAGPLLQKIKAQGKFSPADILITVDAGNLWSAKEAGILSPVDSDILNHNIPAHYRDEDNTWFGFSVRARTMVYNTNNLNPSELSTYEDLADPKWKGRLVLRTAKKVYNQSLVAMMMHRHGPAKTSEVVKGWVNNLAAPVYMKDALALKSVAAGQGDVTLVNTYYFGRLMNENPDLPLAIFWPNQDSTGVHVNLSGAGVVKTSKNKALAISFLEWLSSKEAQSLFADVNMEYPVNKNVEPSDLVQTWGDFVEDKTHLNVAGENQRKAIFLMDAAGYR